MEKIGSFLQFLAILEALMTFSLLMLFDDTRYCFSVIFLGKKLSRINQSGGHSRGSKGSNWTKNGVNWLNTRRFNLESTLNYSKDTNNHLSHSSIISSCGFTSTQSSARSQNGDKNT